MYRPPTIFGVIDVQCGQQLVALQYIDALHPASAVGKEVMLEIVFELRRFFFKIIMEGLLDIDDLVDQQPGAHPSECLWNEGEKQQYTICIIFEWGNCINYLQGDWALAVSVSLDMAVPRNYRLTVPSVHSTCQDKPCLCRVLEVCKERIGIRLILHVICNADTANENSIAAFVATYE